MLKKKLWIVALIAALAMVFASCGGGGGGNEEPKGEESFELVLGDNYQYGHGYQTQVDTGDLHINFHDYISGSVNPGDEFTIKFKVKTSRDLEDALDFGLVDPSAAAGYWRKLTTNYTVGPKTAENAGDGDLEGPPWIKAGEEFEVDLVMVAIAGPAGQADANLKMYFQTSGLCDKENCATLCDWTDAANNPNGGIEGPVTLTFTGFVFERKGEPAGPCCEECEANCEDCAFGNCLGDDKCGTECCVPYVPPTGGTKVIYKLGETEKNATVELVPVTDPVTEVSYLGDESGFVTFSAGYGSAYGQFEVDFGTGSIADYSGVSFKLNKITGDTGYKTVGVAAKASKFTGYLGIAGEAPNAAVVGTKGYQEMLTLEDGGTSVTVDWTVSTFPTESKLWVVIGIHAGGSEYIISDIVFNPKGAGPVDVAVAYSGVTANGSATETSTELTLTFDKAIAGLEIGDITLSGSTGATKGTLSGAGPTYTLTITGVTGNGSVAVAVAKQGFAFTPTSQSTNVFFYEEIIIVEPTPVEEIIDLIKDRNWADITLGLLIDAELLAETAEQDDANAFVTSLEYAWYAAVIAEKISDFDLEDFADWADLYADFDDWAAAYNEALDEDEFYILVEAAEDWAALIEGFDALKTELAKDTDAEVTVEMLAAAGYTVTNFEDNDDAEAFTTALLEIIEAYTTANEEGGFEDGTVEDYWLLYGLVLIADATYGEDD